MRVHEIRKGQKFWHNGRKFIATSDAMKQGDSEFWMIVWTENEDGESETLVLARNGAVLPA